MNSKNTVARLDNFLIYNGKFKLTAKEQKVVLFLAARINPIKQKRLHAQIVPIKEIRRVLTNKTGGSFYEEIQKMSARLIKKGIEFSSDIQYEGRILTGHRNWFQSIEPIRNEHGEICLEFLFSEKLVPFLLDLKEYTQINYLETLPLGSGFSVRMFLIFRAHRDRMSAHQKKSKLRYDLQELKDLLGVSDKYPDYRNFRKFVLEIIDKEVNKETSIGLTWKPLKKGRSVAEIEFEFWDKKGRSKAKALPVQASLFAGLKFEAMTYAERKAFDRLIAYSIKDEVALEMISRVGGSETQGFEDWYFEEVIQIFEAKTEQTEGAARAGTLVNWFLKMKIFEQNDHFATIMERLQARKKKLQLEKPANWGNRMIAKNMTAVEFETLAKQQRARQ
ncbi:MAG: replication initiation protein [Bacteroidota bacterium]